MRIKHELFIESRVVTEDVGVALLRDDTELITFDQNANRIAVCHSL